MADRTKADAKAILRKRKDETLRKMTENDNDLKMMKARIEAFHAAVAEGKETMQ